MFSDSTHRAALMHWSVSPVHLCFLDDLVSDTKTCTHQCMPILLSNWNIFFLSSVFFCKWRRLNCKRWHQTLVLPTHCCLEVLEVIFQCLIKPLIMQQPHHHKHTLDGKQTCCIFVSKHLETDNVVYVLVILRQRKVTMRPVWRYNVGDLFLLDQTCFKKRNCESFYCLKQTATAPKNINEPSKNLWFWEFVCSGVKNKAVYDWSSTPGAKLRTLSSNSIQFYSYCR